MSAFFCLDGKYTDNCLSYALCITNAYAKHFYALLTTRPTLSFYTLANTTGLYCSHAAFFTAVSTFSCRKYASTTAFYFTSKTFSKRYWRTFYFLTANILYLTYCADKTANVCSRSATRQSRAYGANSAACNRNTFYSAASNIYATPSVFLARPDMPLYITNASHTFIKISMNAKSQNTATFRDNIVCTNTTINYKT